MKRFMWDFVINEGTTIKVELMFDFASNDSGIYVHNSTTKLYVGNANGNTSGDIKYEDSKKT